eukprot:scaffold4204_cov140-Cylindrotheca_fusiformis.AAC.7
MGRARAELFKGSICFHLDDGVRHPCGLFLNRDVLNCWCRLCSTKMIQTRTPSDIVWALHWSFDVLKALSRIAP